MTATRTRIVVRVLCLLGPVPGAAAQSTDQRPNSGRAYVDRDKEPAGALQRAIDRAAPGDRMLVGGTCNENVSILPGKDLLTLDGGGIRTIDAPNAAVNALQIRGPKGVTVRGVTIRGGRAGIDVSRGATVLIDGNTIEATGRNGITLGSFAPANIVNNTIQNNASAGILVTGNAFGFIGFARAGLFDAPNRTIVNNVLRGVACRVGGPANGRRGALSGIAGPKDFGTGCVDSLDVADTF